MVAPPPPLAYDLRIGVTGHRHLNDEGAVAEAVRALLDRIVAVLSAGNREPGGPAGSPKSWAQRLDASVVHAAEYVLPWLPKTPAVTPEDRLTPIRMTVFSSLARGADRIVAAEVLRRPGSTLQAVLPMPADAYRQDFVEPQDLREFDQLLRHDEHPTVVQEIDPAVSADAASARNEAYLQAGRRVVDACEILIVIWDGQPARGRGGTADVIRDAIDRDRLILWIDSRNPSAEPRRLRRSTPHGPTDTSPDPDRLACPLPVTARDLSVDFHQLSSYNRDGGFRETKWRRIHDRHRRTLIEHAERAGLGTEQLQPILEILLPHYARADQLANLYHGLYVRGAIGLCSLSALAVSVAAVQALLFPHAAWLIVFEVLAMLLAVVLLRIGRSEAWHEKWLRDRYLAERIRSAIFTTLARTHHAGGGPAPEEILPFYRGRGFWLNDIPDRLQRQCRSSIPATADTEAVRRFIVEAWLLDQARWHRRNAHRRERKARIGHFTGQMLFTATLVAAGLHLAGVGHDGQGDRIAHAITALTILLPAWGAAVHAMNGLLEHHRLEHRSRQMGDLLASSAHSVEVAPHAAAIALEVRRAAAAISAENHEWLVSLTFRDLVLPA